MKFNISLHIAVIAGIVVLLGLLVAITPWYIFPVCEARGITSHSMAHVQDGMHGDMPVTGTAGTTMKCGYSARAETVTGILIVLAGFAAFTRKTPLHGKAPGVVVICLGILSVLIASALIGVCSTPDAPCRIGTLPAWILLGSLTVIAGVLLVRAAGETTGGTG